MPEWQGPGPEWGWQSRPSAAGADGGAVLGHSCQAAREQPARAEDVPGLAAGHGLQQGPGHPAHLLQCRDSEHQQPGHQMVTTAGLCWGCTGTSAQNIALQNHTTPEKTKPWFLPLAFHFSCLSFPPYSGFLHSDLYARDRECNSWSSHSLKWRFTAQNGLLQEGEMILLLGLQSLSTQEFQYWCSWDLLTLVRKSPFKGQVSMWRDVMNFYKPCIHNSAKKLSSKPATISSWCSCHRVLHTNWIWEGNAKWFI